MKPLNRGRASVLALALAAGSACLTTGTSTAATTSTEYTVYNSGWAAPQTSGYVAVKCPSSYPYPEYVTAAISGEKVKLGNFTSANYPGTTKLEFFNGNPYSNPAKNVWVTMTVTCSSLNPGSQPQIALKKEVTIPEKGLIFPGTASVALKCPTNTPYYAGGTWKFPDLDQIELDSMSVNDEPPQEVMLSLNNYSSSPQKGYAQIYCRT
ncbi:hypothetical protein ACH4ZX_40200 [Streptomyces sp. NPDC020490]|uniref:hypothetical protein n=1 Tax=Streptomyces sp. NPDC020490 TaxID=3365078 RepID=UPI00379444FA